MHYFKYILAFNLLIVLANCEHFLVTSHVHFDITIDSKEIGRITFGMFAELAPRTVRNFETICEKGVNGKTYAGTIFHRVIDRSIIQGGDIVSNDGKGIVSIYGKQFEDENLRTGHTGPGFLAMANNGPHTNGCQFYITTTATPWLNGQSTIFGKVVHGAGYVHLIEKQKTGSDYFPLKRIKISACSVEKISSSYYISDNPYDLWSWIRASAVPLGMSFTILAIFHLILRRLNQYTDNVDELMKMGKDMKAE